MRKIRIVHFILLLSAVISGCASMERPVLQHQIANVGTLSTIASRRVVVVNSSFKLKEPYIESAFCAEPPPDVTENIISSLTGKGEVAGEAKTNTKVAEIEAQIRLELAKNFQNVGQVLFKRTQGVQFLRDGLFNLCQAYINGALTKQEYAQEYYKIIDKSVELMKIEIPFLYK
jgi:hypothetical protein